MIELHADLWRVSADATVITTNGYVKANNGRAVMGRGCARQAREKFPGIDRALGWHIEQLGNVVGVIWLSPVIISFPVKHFWWDSADMELIEQSTKQLVRLANSRTSLQTIVMPRPGCGNGGLRWENVKPVLERYLDNRFRIVEWERTSMRERQQ